MVTKEQEKEIVKNFMVRQAKAKANEIEEAENAKHQRRQRDAGIVSFLLIVGLLALLAHENIFPIG